MESKYLYVSISINLVKAVRIHALIDQLNNGKDDLMKRTKLCLSDIYELPKFCLSKSHF